MDGQATIIDQDKLHAFVGRAINDLAAGSAGVMISLGQKLGLYKALAGAGPLTAAEVAQRAGCAERYVREWLNAQVAGGYLAYDAGAGGRYTMSPEQAMVLANEESPVFIPNAWEVVAAMWLDETKSLEAFKTGKGVPWGDHHDRLYCGVAAFFRNGYRASLVKEWLPALDGVTAKLERGIAVADVGCGYGHSTVQMAEAFPRSRFTGFDAHAPSIAAARGNAAEAGVADRATFVTARATDYAAAAQGARSDGTRGDGAQSDGGYDLICFFDCLHDMGDPVAAAKHAAKRLAPDGTVMLVEPFADAQTEGSVSPVARLYYSGSTAICCAHAISEGGKMVLGAQAGEARLAEVFREAGFTRFRRAAATPFNLILEARL